MRKALILAFALPMMAGPATGQALKGHNTNAPVDVAADRIEVQDRADRAIFVGNVRVNQADLTLASARLTVAYANGANAGVQIERLDATGGVTIRKGDQTAQGNTAIYDLPRRLITMVGGVTLTQGGNRVSGGRMVIDLNSGRAVVDGSSVGAPGTQGGAGGRVTGRFTVKKAQ
ncbi:MAG: LptA/OstA family protein [Sphingomonadales bacterium]|nr:LptA/OstA family protein [Sphingomonadales bacterium]